MSFPEAVAVAKTEYDKISPSEIADFLVGERFLHEQRAPGDVVWVNPGGEFTTHPGAGPEFLDDGTTQSPMLYDDNASFSCFVWGTSEEAAKVIMVDIIRALSIAWGWGNLSLDGYVAVTEEEDSGGYVWSGFSYALRGSVKLMMARETTQAVPIDSNTTTGAYE